MHLPAPCCQPCQRRRQHPRTLVLFQSQMNSLPSPSPLITKRLSQLKATWHA